MEIFILLSRRNGLLDNVSGQRKDSEVATVSEEGREGCDAKRVRRMKLF